MLKKVFNSESQSQLSPLSFHLDTPLLAGLPTDTTLYELFKNFLTIQAVPKRYFFELLSHFTTSELEEERLLEFCSPEGQVGEEKLLFFASS